MVGIKTNTITIYRICISNLFQPNVVVEIYKKEVKNIL